MYKPITLIFLLIGIISCQSKTKKSKVSPNENKKGMVWIPGSTFQMGSEDNQARPDEGPVHKVKVDGFWIDQTEVTNAQFAKFIEETGYVTTAEQPVNWEEMKKQLPPDTPKPHDTLLQASSLVFKPTAGPVDLNNFSAWWEWKPKADWRSPRGKGSTIEGKEIIENLSYPLIYLSD